jgi:hypothetical protein
LAGQTLPPLESYLPFCKQRLNIVTNEVMKQLLQKLKASHMELCGLGFEAAHKIFTFLSEESLRAVCDT